MYAIPTHNNLIKNHGAARRDISLRAAFFACVFGQKKFFIRPSSYLRIEYSFAIIFP